MSFLYWYLEEIRYFQILFTQNEHFYPVGLHISNVQTMTNVCARALIDGGGLNVFQNFAYWLRTEWKSEIQSIFSVSISLIIKTVFIYLVYI